MLNRQRNLSDTAPTLSVRPKQVVHQKRALAYERWLDNQHQLLSQRAEHTVILTQRFLDDSRRMVLLMFDEDIMIHIAVTVVQAIVGRRVVLVGQSVGFATDWVYERSVWVPEQDLCGVILVIFTLVSALRACGVRVCTLTIR